MLIPTETFAQVLGPLYTVAGLAIFFNRDRWKKMVKKLDTESLSLLLASLLSFGAGICFVILQLSDDSTLSLVIKIFGWFAMIKGAHGLLFPESFVKIAKKVTESNSVMTFGGLVALLIGMYFVVMGF